MRRALNINDIPWLDKVLNEVLAYDSHKALFDFATISGTTDVHYYRNNDDRYDGCFSYIMQNFAHK